METLVHAEHPDVVLSEFHLVLRPGGRLVMFEYSKDPEALMTDQAAEVLRYVNEMAAMPAMQSFDHGILESLMVDAGFGNIQVVEITEHVLPMLRVFSLVGFAPYWIASRLGQRERVVNAMAGVEIWRHRRHFRYNIYSANRLG